MRFYKQKFGAMGSPCEIGLYAASAVAAQRAFDISRAEVFRLDGKYSDYADGNYLAIMTRRATRSGGVHPDAETAALLDYAAVQHRESGGLFDITAGPLSSLWRDRRDLPEQAEIDAALAMTGWTKAHWDGARLRLLDGMRLDLGAVVKEYAADRAAYRIQSLEIHSGYVDLGGDLHVLGPHPDGTPWKVGIRSANGCGTAVAAIDVVRGGLATSGDYERFCEIDGIRCGHIVNPMTGWPVNVGSETLTSVSVRAHSCLLAGSVATLASLVGAVAGIQLLADSGLPWLAVRRDGDLTGTISGEVRPAEEPRISACPQI